jgi:CRP-like cAMP-binding protein
VAGRVENNQERVLEVLNTGDFFGEIAALTGVPRTANVVTSQETKLLRIPAEALRLMGTRPELNRLVYSKMTERMVRMNMIGMPG